MQTREINVLVLAYLGDTIYENYVRKYLIGCGISNVNDLQKEAVNYVSAKSQAAFLKDMMDDNFLIDEEGRLTHAVLDDMKLKFEDIGVTMYKDGIMSSLLYEYCGEDGFYGYDSDKT